MNYSASSSRMPRPLLRTVLAAAVLSPAVAFGANACLQRAYSPLAVLPAPRWTIDPVDGDKGTGY